MADTRCIVSCCYSSDGRYHQYARRLEESLAKHGKATGLKIWWNEFPPGSPPHQEIHYAFKYYAVKWAKEQGHRYVCWLDAGAYAIASPEPMWEELARRGVYIAGANEPLGEWISDQALAYFGVSRDEAMQFGLCAGCVVGFDFENEAARAFFDEWGALAQTKLFISAHSRFAPDKMKSLWVSDHDERVIVSEDPRFKGHRSDEACFALMLRKRGMRHVGIGVWNECFRTGY